MSQLKDLLKALSSFDKSPEHLKQAQNALNSFIQQQSSSASSASAAAHNDAAEDRLSSQLLEVYKSYNPPILVAPLPDLRLVDFLGFLQRLQPFCQKKSFFNDWWESLILPCLLLVQEKALLEVVKQIACHMLSGCTDEALNSVLLEAIHLLKSCLVLDQPDPDIIFRKHSIDVTQSGPLKNLLDCCYAYGNNHAKPFFSQLDLWFNDHTLQLASSFFLLYYLQRLPLHAHQIVHTPLLNTLLATLQTSKNILTIAVCTSCLIILLPRICTAIGSSLDDLLIIFGRLLLWEDLKDSNGDSGDSDSTLSFSPDTDPVSSAEFSKGDNGNRIAQTLVWASTDPSE
jgi:hypothetical protein